MKDANKNGSWRDQEELLDGERVRKKSEETEGIAKEGVMQTCHSIRRNESNK